MPRPAGDAAGLVLVPLRPHWERGAGCGCGLACLTSPHLSLSSSPPFRSSQWGGAGDPLGLWGLSPGGSAHPFLIRALAEPVLQPSCFPPRRVLRADTTACSNVLCVTWASPALATQGRKGRRERRNGWDSLKTEVVLFLLLFFFFLILVQHPCLQALSASCAPASRLPRALAMHGFPARDPPPECSWREGWCVQGPSAHAPFSLSVSACFPGSRIWWGEGATGVLWNPNRTDSQSSCLGKLCKQRGPPILGMFPGKALRVCNQNSQ